MAAGSEREESQIRNEDYGHWQAAKTERAGTGSINVSKTS